MSEIIEILRTALQTELSTEAGRLDLAFGVMLTSAVCLLYADDLVTKLGDFILEVFKRRPTPDRPGHKLAALICLMIYFLISVLISRRSAN